MEKVMPKNLYIVQSYEDGKLVERCQTDDLDEAWRVADRYHPAEIINTRTNTIVQG
jgi:aspartokinase-like uncharacterized kinase